MNATEAEFAAWVVLFVTFPPYLVGYAVGRWGIVAHALVFYGGVCVLALAFRGMEIATGEPT